MHSAGDTDAPEALEVLATVLGRDTRHHTATETLRTELEAATDPARLESLYRHGVDLAAAAFTAATLPDYLDALPRAHAHQLEADPEQYTILESAWTAAAKAGRDPREHWADITDDIDSASAPGALIASRLRHVTEAPGDLPSPPPVAMTTDTELHAWLLTTYQQLTTSQDEPTTDDEPATSGELDLTQFVTPSPSAAPDGEVDLAQLVTPSMTITQEDLAASYRAGRDAERAAARDADNGPDERGGSPSSRPDTSPDLG